MDERASDDRQPATVPARRAAAGCVHQHRFLDRTGDEIHTSMEAGTIVRKGDIKQAKWLDAYERNNVDVGLVCGLRGKAQIGKGMWAIPDRMARCYEPRSAIPVLVRTRMGTLPTAATLHALHYHMVDVAKVQAGLVGRQRASLDDILTPPLANPPAWQPADIEAELNNNAQGILGYVSAGSTQESAARRCRTSITWG